MFYLFLFYLVIKGSMRNNAVMSVGDTVLKIKSFKQMIMFFFRSYVVNEPGFITLL